MCEVNCKYFDLHLRAVAAVCERVCVLGWTVSLPNNEKQQRIKKKKKKTKKEDVYIGRR